MYYCATCVRYWICTRIIALSQLDCTIVPIEFASGSVPGLYHCHNLVVPLSQLLYPLHQMGSLWMCSRIVPLSQLVCAIVPIRFVIGFVPRFYQCPNWVVPLAQCFFLALNQRPPFHHCCAAQSNGFALVFKDVRMFWGVLDKGCPTANTA